MARGFLFRVPERCTTCRTLGSVKMEQTVKGNVVVVTWCCRFCNTDWPVTPADHVERRRGTDERRLSPLVERRKHLSDL